METKVTHRRYPEINRDYKAISTPINRDTQIYYYTLIDKGICSEGVEVYTGANYVAQSIAKSYSRRYEMSNVPKKYTTIVEALKNMHNQTIWSEDTYVNIN